MYSLIKLEEPVKRESYITLGVNYEPILETVSLYGYNRNTVKKIFDKGVKVDSAYQVGMKKD